MATRTRSRWFRMGVGVLAGYLCLVALIEIVGWVNQGEYSNTVQVTTYDAEGTGYTHTAVNFKTQAVIDGDDWAKLHEGSFLGYAFWASTGFAPRKFLKLHPVHE